MVKTATIGLWLFLSVCFFVPHNGQCGEDRFVILNDNDEEIFNVDDKGGVAVSGALLTNGASVWGSAPFVLGQDAGNRGIVITNKAATNPKNIYFGWDIGSSQSYAEMFALQEGVDWMNFVVNPNGGNVGIGNKNPSFPLHMGSGAYVTSGGVWTNASSREYKTDIKQLTKVKAFDALDHLRPVEFAYKADAQEKHVGFIAEEAPALVATKNKKGMSPMDVVAVLTKVVQEQRSTIDDLSKRLALMETIVKTRRNIQCKQ
ncbi:MAG: tail fiber domain-containing protein [Deltaproteobacteria bacterium]|nr:tail fiber domain-containing protein [Deltaproteobacteria bacterium]